MKDSTLDLLVTIGQISAIVFAILASVAGGVAGLAGQQLARRSDSLLQAANLRILDLQETNARLRLQVGTVIGGAWTPLSSTQIEDLRKQIVSWNFERPNIQIMYENKFGKDLAESIAIAFRAAKWNVMFSTGSGFEDGVEVGRGPISIKMQKALSSVMKITDVRAPRLDEPETALFVGVGAKLEAAP